MSMTSTPRSILNRRGLLAASAGSLAAALLSRPTAAESGGMLRRPIPSTGELVPAIGMGSWITFDVGDNAELRAARAEVLRQFFALGGSVVDSSPMYGSSEEVIGDGLKRVGGTPPLFAATKVWTWRKAAGQRQIARSRRLWGLKRFDLLQVHNLLNWEAHLEALAEEKANGAVRHVGVTTSHGLRHDEMERVMTSAPVDFVQFTYNILDREAEARLLPIAAERKLAVIVNRPFQRGALISRFAAHRLPEWAGEIGCHTWAGFLLKFAISHPAVTCAIPATSRVDHMRENMAALAGPAADRTMRDRMIRYVESL
jgi:diketogulonate reductase-like aldo/keto reductase